MILKKCSICKERDVIAKGLCFVCYNRLKRRERALKKKISLAKELLEQHGYTVLETD